jgi:hypothetical protein
VKVIHGGGKELGDLVVGLFALNLRGGEQWLKLIIGLGTLIGAHYLLF